MPVPIRACIVGISGFGQTHHRDLLRQQAKGEIQIVGATVINQADEPEKCAELRALGCELFTDHREMLARLGSTTDLCFIPTGIHLHAPMTIDALRAGANVFVEKPAAATIQEVRAMQAAERETGRFVAVGYQTIYARETLWIKKAILDGKIGALRSISSRALWPRLDSYYGRNRWAGRLKAYGTWVLDSPINNALAHQLNLICFFAGSAVAETARLEAIKAELYRAHDIESADTACLRAVTREGVPLHFFVTHSSAESMNPEILITGENGTLHWNLERARLEAGGRVEEFPSESGQELRDELMAALIGRARGGDNFICSLEIAAAQTLCVNGAHDSSEIHTVPASLVSRRPEGNSIKTVFAGIDEAIGRGFEEGKLFSELSLGWARPGRTIHLRDYRRFPSEQIPVA